MQALVIGDSVELMLPLPVMLQEAGFDVDCVSTRRKLKNMPSLRHFFHAGQIAHLPALAATVLDKQYDLVVMADDISLHAILKSSLDEDDKLALLPVAAVSDFSHLCSKIGLSLVLQRHGISTPDFLIIEDRQALQRAAGKIPFPFMLKGDFSGGGRQTFECTSDSGFAALLKNFNAYPAVLQEKIIGEEIGIEAFYQQGALIHFSYARPLKTVENRKFAPSKLREYTQTGALDATLLDDLRNLGRALGADGFVNISLLVAQADQKRYFFEADMRPTTWIDFPRFFGDAPAQKIKKFFASGLTGENLTKRDTGYPDNIVLPYFLRMALWELAMNRYQVWRYMRWDRVTVYALLRKTKLSFMAILNMRALRRTLKKHF
jgi:hypothetical protein